jgi:hypothetical protein
VVNRQALQSDPRPSDDEEDDQTAFTDAHALTLSACEKKEIDKELIDTS